MRLRTQNAKGHAFGVGPKFVLAPKTGGPRKHVGLTVTRPAYCMGSMLSGPVSQKRSIMS